MKLTFNKIVDITLILRLVVASGYKPKEVAKAAGCSQVAVYRTLKNAGARYRGGRWNTY